MLELNFSARRTTSSVTRALADYLVRAPAPWCTRTGPGPVLRLPSYLLPCGAHSSTPSTDSIT